VTGAAGKTGRAVVRALVARGERVRALVFRAEQAVALNPLGPSDVVVADMSNAAALAAAMRGTATVYFICPNMHPDEHELGRLAVEAASSAGVDRFVYHSVMLPRVREMPHHWQKHLVEEELVRSGLDHVILQPCAYMQNVQAGIRRIVDDGQYTVPYSTRTRLSVVDLDDVAEAAAIVLSSPGHTAKTYELCGPQALSQEDVACALTAELGRPVRATTVVRAEWASLARTAGLGDYAIESLLRMFDYYEREGFCGDPTELEALLGRPATPFSEVVRKIFRDRGLAAAEHRRSSHA